LGISNIRFRPVLPLGRSADVKMDESFTCADEIDVFRPFQPRVTCGLGQNLYVEPDGGAYPCYAWCGRGHRLGNVLRDGLTAVLDGAAFRELSRHDVDTNEQCRVCNARYLCGGVCKAWVPDKNDIDGGGFDCSARKEHFTRILAQLDTED